MSAEALSKLSIGDTMVTTRAGAARAQTTSIQNPQQSPSSSQASSPTPSIIQSASGLRYNLSAFDDDVRRRAKRGLMDDNEIKMKYWRSLGDGQYIFYIDDDITIGMGGSHAVPKCSCGANEGGNACKHLFWMLDKLTTGAPSSITSQTLHLSVDGSTVQGMQPSEMIDKMGLGRVVGGLDWALQDGESPNPQDIEDEIAEMLSVFEPSEALPAEFKVESADPPAREERSRKYREFKDILTQYAVDNLGLFVRLQTVIDPEFQVHVFFEKINDRTARAFKAQEEYIEEYMANGPINALAKYYDVPTCAKRLQSLVKAIEDYYHQQTERESATKDVAIRAAAALITILDGVADRNFDAYANISWQGIAPSDPKESNLFVCLIGAPDEDDGLFVLDTLKALPHDDVLRNHWETLFDLEEKLERQRPPTAYMNAFRSITQENRKRAASGSGGSSAKRPMQ